jgi:hypothetical protein
MSTITSFYTTTFSSKRMVKSGSNRLDTSSTIQTSQACSLQPVQSRSQLFNVDNFGKEFVMRCDSSLDVKPGDIVTIDSVQYGVQGVSLYTDMFEGNDSHLQVSLVAKST